MRLCFQCILLNSRISSFKNNASEAKSSTSSRLCQITLGDFERFMPISKHNTTLEGCRQNVNHRATETYIYIIGQ